MSVRFQPHIVVTLAVLFLCKYDDKKTSLLAGHYGMSEHINDISPVDLEYFA